MNRRKTADRRLHDEIVKDERREMMRRNLDEWRRMKADRRVEHGDLPEEMEERRKKDRRTEAIEDLQADHPEYNLPVDPTK